MSGDWIKMRSNLWDDPRVGRICDLTACKEATVIGALYWLWATADQHTEDGCMPGMSLQHIDRKTGVKGFAVALVSVGWLEDNPQGVVLINFSDHNGVSAKKRIETAKRVAKHRASNADVTPPDPPCNADDVTGALARGSVTSALAREEKRREEKEKEKKKSAEDLGTPPPSAPEVIENPAIQPTAAGLACRAIKAAGIADVNPGHPGLRALLDGGVTADELSHTAAELVGKGKPKFALLLATVEARLRYAASSGPIPKAAPTTVPSSDADRTAAMLAKERQRDQRLDSPEERAAVAAKIAEARARLTRVA